MTEPTTLYRTSRNRRMATPRRAVKVTDGNFALLVVGKNGTETAPALVEIKIDDVGEISFDLDDLKIFLQVIQ